MRNKMLFSKLFSKKANDRNKEVERVHVTGGFWAGISNGKGKYEIYIVYREKDGYILVYDDTHRDGLNDEMEEKKSHKEMILGYDYFQTHTLLEFGKLLSQFSDKGPSSLDKEKYQELCQMELKRMGIEIEETHAPLPKIEELICGSSVYFGSYFQDDGIHKTPIEWEVLEVKEGTALLISKKALLVSGYCDHGKIYEDLKYMEWSHSLARKVCNQDFYNSAFSDEEKECLVPKEIEEAGFGLLCKDKVFLLSEREIRLFMPDEAQRKCEPTKYAQKNGVRMGWAGDEAYISWWLLPEYDMNCGKVRSASGVSYDHGIAYPKAVFHNGEIGFHGRNVYHSDFVIRPCILLNVFKDEECVPESIDYAVTNFCKKYINPMKEMYENPELRKWCKEYSAYHAISTHLNLQKLVYDEFMKEAYEFPFFAEYLARTDYGKNFEKRLKGNKAELITGLFVEIRGDYGSNGSLINHSIADGRIYQLMDAYLQHEENDYYKERNYQVYELEYIKALLGKERRYGIGERYVYHDVSLKKWRLTIQLDEEKYYFLSVFIDENGMFEKFSLDEEGVSDSHYEFKDERELRKKLYVAGDEDRYLDEILIRYASQYGPRQIKELIWPYITAQFHYD